MKFVIKILLLVALLFGAAVIGNVYFGDLSAPESDITTPVTIDVK